MSVLENFACDLLSEVEVDYLQSEWNALGAETRRKAKRNPALQKVYHCITAKGVDQ
jgi:hypothetical protein